MKKKLFFLIFFLFYIINISQSYCLEDKNIIDDENLSKLLKFIKIFKENSRNQISDNEIIDKMINGFLKETDQYGNFFLNKNDYEKFNSNLKENYNGIGVYIEKKNFDSFIISKIDKNSNAFKAGLKINDVVNLINNKQPTETGNIICDIDKNVFLNITRYQNINIENPIVENSFDIILACENIKNQNISYKLVNNDILILKINKFFDNLSLEIDKILKDPFHNNIKGIIIDLRDNGGGLRDEAVLLASRFFEKKTLLFNAKSNINKIIGKFDSKPEFFIKKLINVNVIILVNKNSASASEIFAASLRDNNRAIIIGQKTYGKGSGQSIFQVKNDSFIKITTSLVTRITGQEIEKNGIIPDIDIDEKITLMNNYDEKIFSNINDSNKNNNEDIDLIKDLELYITYKIMKTKIL